MTAALDASPSRIPVLLGGCGSGRSTLLHQVHERGGRTSAQYIDVEHTATTPERFHQAVAAGSPFPPGASPAPGARAAFDATLAILAGAHGSGGQAATFLLDEFLEVRTFESFPGLRQVVHELLDGLAASSNHFVLTSRYPARSLRLLRDRSARFEVIHMPPLSTEDVVGMLRRTAGDDGPQDAEYAARAVQALADGRPSYVSAIAEQVEAMGPGGDIISALAALLAPGGTISGLCHFSYELRLHRARGYGALKAILDILAENENLTLTEISQQLHRTPGSTKDYLSWLEDVDLVTARQKRYSFTDPLLRVWVRLYCHGVPPSDDDVAREIHRFAAPRLPRQEPALALAAVGASAPDEERKDWGIIEID